MGAKMGSITLINSYYGLPMQNLFSIALNSEGLSNVKKRTTYFGTIWVYRYIKSKYPDARMWDESYRFSLRSCNIQFNAQREFIRLMGEKRISDIESKARSLGLEPYKLGYKKPDIAVYCPEKRTKWRFFEVKRVDKGDTLSGDQMKWMELLADYFGKKAVIELSLIQI
jgi:hypothetical protein